MLERNRMALKEWAAVVWALGQGAQILLLRKGGIAEEEGEFRLAAKEFFLYPTYEHQQAGLLQSQFADTFRALAAKIPAEGDLMLEYYVAITDVLPAPELTRVKQLRDCFVWNDAFLEKRYQYKPQLPLYFLILRTFRLPGSIRIPIRECYAGCRSWVELEESLPTQGAVPVLTEWEFKQRRELLLSQLAATAVTHAQHGLL